MKKFIRTILNGLATFLLLLSKMSLIESREEIIQSNSTTLVDDLIFANLILIKEINSTIKTTTIQKTHTEDIEIQHNSTNINSSISKSHYQNVLFGLKVQFDRQWVNEFNDLNSNHSISFVQNLNRFLNATLKKNTINGLEKLIDIKVLRIYQENKNIGVSCEITYQVNVDSKINKYASVLALQIRDSIQKSSISSSPNSKSSLAINLIPNSLSVNVVNSSAKLSYFIYWQLIAFAFFIN